MIAWLLHRVREWRSVVRSGEANRAIAWGLGLGVLLGLLPKENLLAGIVASLILATRASWSAAGLAALVVSVVAPVLDPWTDVVGETLLTASLLGPLWSGLYELPFVPWTRFNNTVVLGSLVTGLALVAPTSLAAHRVLDWMLPPSNESVGEEEPAEAGTLELPTAPIASPLPHGSADQEKQVA